MRLSYTIPAAVLGLCSSIVHAQNSSTKRGLVHLEPSPNWPKSAAQDYKLFISQPSDLTWYYNYGANPTIPLKNDASKLLFVPMLWGTSNTEDTTFLDTVTAAVKNGQKIDSVLFFNEPDMVAEYGGSNVAASVAAKIWRKQMEPLKSLRGDSIGGNGTIKLGGPAVTGAPSGLKWLKDFRSACDKLGGCSVDFLPVHWYDNFGGLASHIGEKQATFLDWGKEIWVTEYAYAKQDLSDTQSFYKTSAEYFDRMENITRYSYFGAFRSSVSNVGPNVPFLDGYGKLTDIGAWYLGRPSTGVIPSSKGEKGAGLKLYLSVINLLISTVVSSVLALV